jgi:hypothetical protein
MKKYFYTDERDLKRASQRNRKQRLSQTNANTGGTTRKRRHRPASRWHLVEVGKGLEFSGGKRLYGPVSRCQCGN